VRHGVFPVGVHLGKRLAVVFEDRVVADPPSRAARRSGRDVPLEQFDRECLDIAALDSTVFTVPSTSPSGPAAAARVAVPAVDRVRTRGEPVAVAVAEHAPERGAAVGEVGGDVVNALDPQRLLDVRGVGTGEPVESPRRTFPRRRREPARRRDGTPRERPARDRSGVPPPESPDNRSRDAPPSRPGR